MTKNHQKNGKGVLERRISRRLHKPVRRKFQRRQVLVNEIDDVCAADLVELQGMEKCKHRLSNILNVIYCFSKYVWSVPLKDKKGETVLDAFKYIVKTSNRKPMFICLMKERNSITKT